MPRPGYPQEQIDWLMENVPGNTWEDITEGFNLRFGTTKCLSTLRAYANRSLGIQTNRDTRLQKGLTPWNKGMGKEEWISHFSEESRERYETRKTCGQPPKPIGHEMHGYYGNVMIKTENGFIRKDRYVYENSFGKIPDDSVLIHLDGDKDNCNIDNLLLVSRRISARAYKCFGKIDGNADRMKLILELVKLEDLINGRESDVCQESKY